MTGKDIMEIKKETADIVLTKVQMFQQMRGVYGRYRISSKWQGLCDIVDQDLGGPRDIELARATGGHLHVAHVSTKGTVDIIRRAKEQGLRGSLTRQEASKEWRKAQDRWMSD